MSDECCGPARPTTNARAPLTLTSRPASEADACCGPAPTPAPIPIEDGDACCGSTTPAPPGEPIELEQSTPWWRDRSLLLPATAGVLWVAGLLLDWAGLDLVALIVHVLALAAGAWTFVPSTLRRLVQGRGRGRLGVGLLMTIAATGAVLLGHVGEAAALAFLFSLAEALEDRSMDRAKQGLRALLALIPETARIQRPDGPQTVPAADVRAGDVLLRDHGGVHPRRGRARGRGPRRLRDRLRLHGAARHGRRTRQLPDPDRAPGRPGPRRQGRASASR